MIHDLTSREFLTDPGPILARMRAEGPLVRTRLPLIGEIWLTTTDAGARTLLKSPDLFARNNVAAGGRSLAERFWWLPPFMKPLLTNMLAYDGAAHLRLRRLVDSAFARTEVEDMRPAMAALAAGLLADLPTDRPVDIRAGLAKPFPLAVICTLLGIPEADRDRISRWIAPISGAVNGFTFLAALPGFWRLLRYFRAEFARVRVTPRPGLITALVQAEADGDRLSEDELLGMVVTLFIAGHETTVHLITDAILAALTDPQARAAIPDGLPLLVEEIMRFHSPVMMSKPHYVTRDTDILGMPLKKDDQVAALLIGANRDPARHAEPDALRPDRRPNAHLGFGHGPHVCLGMQLARAEAQVALATLFATYPDVRLADPDAPVDWSRRTGIHGPARLDVVLSPRR